MSVSHGIKLSGITVQVAMLALCGFIAATRISVAQPATDAQVEGADDESDLRWKPHRFANAPLRGEEAQPTAPEAATTDVVATTPEPQTWTEPAAAGSPPPASVSLPDRVPATTPLPIRPRTPETAPYAPLRGSLARGMQQMGDWFTTDSGAAGQQAATVAPTFAERLMRTPQGQSGRPILDRNTGYGMTDARPIAPLGGGLAPRYSPNVSATAARGNTARRQPSERIAMNVDGIPSVMTRAPQAAAIDSTVPRQPAASDSSNGLPTPRAEVVDAPIVIETSPDMGFDGGMEIPSDGMPGEAMWMGQYPAELHVESFYDDPYACDEEGGALPLHCCDGRICRWMRRFGKPYYGWRWYRDFTASVGVTAFQSESNLGLNGNFGTNEYLNWSMPLWNAFGIGWQVGARGVQTNFQRSTISNAAGTFRTNARDQVFVTTGLFTRAFEGRGLQGGAVYDYLHDSYFDNVNVSQLRAEASYVWGYHELGFWGAFNVGEQSSLFGPVTRTPGQASTENLYTGFYRLQFGDANEWRVWAGGTASQAGIIGSSMRAPMSKSWALEGTFTYLIPGRTENFGELVPGVTVASAPSAWNVSLNVVYYPARRSRRSLASPYRPLFDVADNGSMIRTISR
ncbi:MAG: hypothetical protein O3A37_11620 [Planctomycetota bacterium]|nr:hypothetical protein [Planctomycetota bacterium]